MELKNIETYATQRIDLEGATLLAYMDIYIWHMPKIWKRLMGTICSVHKLQDGAAAEPWHLGQTAVFYWTKRSLR
jgi:trehalose utilization protein